MADSDSDYDAGDLSGTEAPVRPSAAHGTRSTGPAPETTTTKRAAWEDIHRSWDTVVEGEDGTINSAVEGLRDAGKRRRYVLEA